jgi:hypothetical protein
MTNSDHPRLRVRITIVQSIDRNPGCFCHFKGPSLDVDRDHLSMIAFLDLSAHRCLIERITALGKFFFAISGLSDCHRFALATTLLLHFNCVVGEIPGAEGV